MGHFHDSVLMGGHSGEQRTLARLLGRYYWPKMDKDVQRYVRTCEMCQRTKVRRNPVGFLRSLPVPDTTWHTIGMDIAYLPRTTSWGGGLRSIRRIIGMPPRSLL